jgi:hypothetical protein
VDQLEDCLVRLNQLNETLSPFASKVEWREETASFDALDRIADEVRAALRDNPER